MKDFTGRVAVITGGASGIGLALARGLTARGCHVALADIDKARLDAAADALGGRGVRVSTHVVDVSDHAQVCRLRDEALAAHGAVHLVFNNAGVTMYGAFEQFTMEQIQRIMGINVMGVIHGCHVFLPVLREQREAHIVNMASMAAISGMPRQSTYCASKAAVRALSESLSAELAGSPIGVTWMLAGPIGTEIVSRATSHDAAITAKLGSLLQQYAMSPDRAAARILRAVERGERELRITMECEGYHQLNRLAPGTLRASMRALNRVATRFERS